MQVAPRGHCEPRVESIANENVREAKATVRVVHLGNET